MTTYVALLRAVNVGGRNKLSMQALRELLEDLGHTDISTYLQSGNVVFSSPVRRAETLAQDLEEALAADLGVAARVLVRSRSELEQVMSRNPYAATEPDLTKMHVFFLRNRPAKARVLGIDPDRSPPDEFAVDGREIFVHFPNGSGRSKLTATWFESQLDTTATARNWNTVSKLVDLMRG
ncbi:MAG: hypothetical protein JWM05_2822 [Acidimicrobiales bacterium]|nr:hypothetical protein [Acidimicrobiales bacterium]